MKTIPHATFSKILESPWASGYTAKVLSYYQPSAALSKRYALYSSSIDRFVLIDGLDLWAIEHAAKLLSSKFGSIICIFSNEEPSFTTEDCLMWSLVDKKSILPKKQTPEMKIISSNSEITQTGAPIDFLSSLDALVNDQEFALFVLKATSAMRLTDLYWNSSALLNNENQSFYTEFYTDLSAEKSRRQSFENTPDKTGWSKGFLVAIGAILYKAQTINEALAELTNIYGTENFDSRQPLHEHILLKNIKNPLFHQQLYLKTFFDLLGWEPPAL